MHVQWCCCAAFGIGKVRNRWHVLGSAQGHTWVAHGYSMWGVCKLVKKLSLDVCPIRVYQSAVLRGGCTAGAVLGSGTVLSACAPLP